VHGAIIENLAATGALQRRITGTAAEIGARQVGIQHLLPFVGLEIFRPLADVDAGVVDEYVDSAECFDDAIDHIGNRVRVRDIGLKSPRLDIELLKRLRCLRRFFLVAPHHGDIRAGARKPPRHAEADSAVATGDEGNLSRQIEHVKLPAH
jgi:hypothetical protein